MASILERAVQNLSTKLGVDTYDGNGYIPNHAVSDYYGIYEQRMKENLTFKVKFTSCGKDGTFACVDENGLFIIMSSEATKDKLLFFSSSTVSSFVGHEFDVKVTAIDKEQGRIYVQSARGVQVSEKSRIVGEIHNELAKGKYPVVWGCITTIKESVAYVDILGMGIVGRVDCKHWSKTIVRHMEAACKKGEYHQFQITSATPKRKNKPSYFLLERRNLAPNPWSQIPVDLVKEGSVVNVECIELPRDKSYWWGSLSLVSGLEVLCDYPRGDFKIVPGIHYKCRVKVLRINPDNMKDNMFKVVPIGIVAEDLPAYNNYMSMAKRTAREKELASLRVASKVEVTGENVVKKEE